VLASEIGLTARQVIGPNDIVALPVRLSLPFPVDIELSCRPDGGHRDRDRDTLVLSCTFDQNVRTPRLDARVRLAGVEEIDIQTGIRLSSVLTGGLNGRIQLGDRNGAWHSADDRLLYRRNSHAARYSPVTDPRTHRNNPLLSHPIYARQRNILEEEILPLPCPSIRFPPRLRVTVHITREWLATIVMSKPARRTNVP
jgi:hypothetical protein